MKKVLFIFFGLLISLNACQLEDPDSEVYSFDDFEDLFNLAYNNTRTYINGYYLVSEASTDEMIPLSARGPIDDWERLYQHTWRPEDPIMQTVWNELYEGVSFCMLALNASDENDLDIPADFVAELRALRAFYYYLLMDCFGGVSILQPDFAGIAYPARSSRQEVFNYIETELLEAIPDLSNAPFYGRINQDVAYAILAKLYLNAEVYTGNPQWEKCLEACQKVTAPGNFNLLPVYFDNFTSNNHNTGAEEIIFYNVFNTSAIPTGQQMDLQSRSLHYAHFGIIDIVRTPFFATTPEFYNTFDVADTRRNAFLLGPQFKGGDVASDDLIIDTEGNQVDYTLEIPEFPINSESTGARVLKYQMDPNRNGINANNDFAIFRLSDFLLMEAEAQNELGNVNLAIEAINRVRTRGFASGGAGIESGGFNQASLRDQILLERGYELFWEGFRRQDLIRHDQYCKAWSYKEVDDDCEKRKLFPIPQAVIDINDAIIQNPGY